MMMYGEFSHNDQLTDNQYPFFRKHGFIHFGHFASIDGVNRIQNAMKPVEKVQSATWCNALERIPIKYGKDVDGNTIVLGYLFTSEFEVYAFPANEKPMPHLAFMSDGASIAIRKKIKSMQNL